MPEMSCLGYLSLKMHGACPDLRNGPDLTIFYNLRLFKRISPSNTGSSDSLWGEPAQAVTPHHFRFNSPRSPIQRLASFCSHS